MTKQVKKLLRDRMKNKLRKMSNEQYITRSKQIHHQLFHSKVWTDATIIGVTISIFPEVDTYGIINRAWEENKIIAVPKCYPETKEMQFNIITSFDQLESGHYGLKEPKMTETKNINKQDIDVLIVPGVVFNMEGYRIGFGGGYYDRFTKHIKSRLISVAFQDQIVSEIPVEDHDCKVEFIFTENGVHNSHDD